MGQKALGAAFSHARASGKDQSRAAQRRRANDWLKREGRATMSRKVAKGILDRWRALTTDERADEFNLRAAGVPPDVARALAMTGNGKPPKRKPKFGGLISKMGPTLAELDAPGHSTGLTGSQALRGATWRKRKRPKKEVAKGGPGSGPRPHGGSSVASHLSAASSHLAASKVARGKGDHASADAHRQKAADRIQAALRASSVSKAGEWDESKHPRADDGEFGSGSGSHSDAQSLSGNGESEAHAKALTNPQKRAQPAKKGAHPSAGRTPDESEIKEAVDSYRNFGYIGINERARNYGKKEKLTSKMEKQDKRDAEVLSHAINKTSLQKDMTLYRGFNLDPATKVGDILENHGFTSASESKGVANRFAVKAGHSGFQKAVAVIKAPAGTPALDMSKYTASDEKNDEKEFVFDHQTRFRVVEDNGKNGKGYRQIVLEPVLPHPGATASNSAAPKETESGNGARSASLRAALHKSFVAKRHMVSQLADQYIQAAYEPPRLPAGEPQYTDPPEFARYLDAQRLVAGMDEETAAGAQTPAVARARASRALASSMGHYDRAVAGADRALAHVGGLNLDLGSGQARERGFLGVDTYPYDYGTVVADLGLGIPFPDGCARAVRLWGALPALEDYQDDATALMQEVQRVLTIGGRLYYQGPPLQDRVDWSKLPGLGVVSHQFGEGGRQLTLTLQRQAARLPVVYGADVQHLGRDEASPADFAQAQAEFGDLPPANVAMANLVAKAAPVDVRASIVKKRDYDRVCLGVILMPDIPDSQNDTMTAKDIEETAHNFLADARLVGREHSDTWDGAQVVESYIAPCELSFADEMYGPQVVPKGSWILGVRIPEDSWGEVLDGSVTGFSVGGWGEREDLPTAQSAA